MNADELADRVAHEMLAAEGTGPAWGIVIEEAREGYARLRMTIRDDMLNGHQIVHGGMVFSLADTAFAYACNGKNERTVAAQANIVFLDAAKRSDAGDRPDERWTANRGIYGLFALNWRDDRRCLNVEAERATSLPMYTT